MLYYPHGRAGGEPNASADLFSPFGDKERIMLPIRMATTRRKLTDTAAYIMRVEEWFDSCPIASNDDEQHVRVRVEQHLRKHYEIARTLAETSGQDELAESINCFMEEGELGGHEDALHFWQHVQQMAND